MRNIAEIIKDERKGKQLSQTERQIAVAYTQGKYDAVRELNLIGNSSNTNEILDKICLNISNAIKKYPKTYSDKIYDAVTVYEGIGEVEQVGIRKGLELAIDLIKGADTESDRI